MSDPDRDHVAALTARGRLLARYEPRYLRRVRTTAVLVSFKGLDVLVSSRTMPTLPAAIRASVPDARALRL